MAHFLIKRNKCENRERERERWKKKVEDKKVEAENI